MAHIVSLVMLLTVAFMAVTVESQFDVYARLGAFAEQMQTVKTKHRDTLKTIKSGTENLKKKFLALNDTVFGAKDSVDKILDAMDLVSGQLSTAANVASVDDLPAPALTSPPAFQAYFASTTANGYKDYTFKYATVTLNDGGHYSPTTGYFTAPKPGLYYFHATFTAVGTKYAKIQKIPDGGTVSDGVPICKLLYYTSQETACIVTTFLNTNDKVGMFGDEKSPLVYSMSPGEGNTFLGYLVAEYDF